jgi:hypothetical protein
VGIFVYIREMVLEIVIVNLYAACYNVNNVLDLSKAVAKGQEAHSFSAVCATNKKEKLTSANNRQDYTISF